MPLFALVDCANFYVSCERVFNPRLRGVPVVVLSNNDGCVISRSEEAKAMGVEMGAPYFQVDEFLQNHGGVALSSNYELYGDMSQRVMNILGSYSARCEVYSIDEAFLELPEGGAGVAARMRELRATVRQHLGLPVRVGVAETKTLAKLGNRCARKSADGVCRLPADDARDQILERTPVGDVWGIGRRWSARLCGEEVATARQFRDMPDRWVRRRLGVVGLRVSYELRGVPCITMDTCPAPKHSIASTRSFSRPVLTRDELRQAATHFMGRAAEKLRRQDSAAGVVTVFVLTDRFQNDPYFRAATTTLPLPTADTLTLAEHARRLVDVTYRQGRRFKKLGVILSEICPASGLQLSLFAAADTDARRQLMRTVDALNRRFGQGSVFPAATLHRPWQTRCEMRSPRYTTRWEELLKVS